MKKIMIIGCPASGKSTLGKIISKQLGIPIFHLDKYFWMLPKGVKQDDFISHQKQLINNNPSWIIDGDFTKSQSFDLRLAHADTIIMYDLPKYLIYFRFIKRSIRDFGKSRPDMPEHRKETLATIWHLAKYIWSYSNALAEEKIKSVVGDFLIYRIKNLNDERFIREMMKH